MLPPAVWPPACILPLGYVRPAALADLARRMRLVAFRVKVVDLALFAFMFLDLTLGHTTAVLGWPGPGGSPLEQFFAIARHHGHRAPFAVRDRLLCLPLKSGTAAIEETLTASSVLLRHRVSPARPNRGHRPGRRWMGAGLVTIAQLIVVPDATIVNIALPSPFGTLQPQVDLHQGPDRLRRLLGIGAPPYRLGCW